MQTFERLKRVVGGFRRTNSRPKSSLGPVPLGMLFPAVVTSVTETFATSSAWRKRRLWNSRLSCWGFSSYELQA